MIRLEPPPTCRENRPPPALTTALRKGRLSARQLNGLDEIAGHYEAVARAAPDGYTIDIGQWDNHVANGVVYTLNYDLQKDFEPIGGIMRIPQLLVVSLLAGSARA